MIRCIMNSLAVALLLMTAGHNRVAASEAVSSAGGDAIKSITVSGAWARATPAGLVNGAAYLSVMSAGKTGDRLIAIASPVAERVEIHGHAAKDGRMFMEMLPAVELPAGKTITFKPGGLHLMLFGLRQPLKAGSRLPLTLTFAKAGITTVSAGIEPAWSLGPEPQPAPRVVQGAAVPRGSHGQ